MFGVGEVLFFRNSRFPCQIQFCIDFLMVLEGFRSYFGSQNGIKMDLRIDQNFDGFLDRSWKRSWTPKDAPAGGRSARPGSTGKGREGVNPSPRDGGIEALRHCWKEDAPKPPVAQRAGGITYPYFFYSPNSACT